MSVWPFLRTPFTDLTGNLMNHQSGHCAKMEMNVMDCLEAYGLERGIQKCEQLIKDFQECAGIEKQLKRTFAMRAERNRQYRAGERSKEDHYAPPPKFDSY